MMLQTRHREKIRIKIRTQFHYQFTFHPFTFTYLIYDPLARIDDQRTTSWTCLTLERFERDGGSVGAAFTVAQMGID